MAELAVTTGMESPAPGSSMTLSQVYSRGVRLQWYEAVAAVCALSEHLLSSGTGRTLIPNLDQITLGEGGSIDVTGGTPAALPVQRLGEILEALIVASEVPVQLRLLIADAIAPVPVYQSIRHFIAALAYFERPDRAAVLDGVYRRATVAAVAPDARRVTVESLVHHVAERAERPAATARGRVWVRWTLVSAVCVGAAFAAVRLVAFMPSRSVVMRDEAAVSSAAKRTAHRVSRFIDRTALSALSAVSERFGLGRLVTADSASTSTDAQTEAQLPRRPARTRRPFRTPSSVMVGYDLESSAPQSEVLGSGARAPFVRGRDRVGADLTIYTARAADVAPPVGMRPAFSGQVPAPIDPGKLERMEVVVGWDGHVEAATLLDSPQGLNERALCDAARRWQFKPATRNGVPVRYRKIIWILP